MAPQGTTIGELKGIIAGTKGRKTIVSCFYNPWEEEERAVLLAGKTKFPDGNCLFRFRTLTAERALAGFIGNWRKIPATLPANLQDTLTPATNDVVEPPGARHL